MSDMPTECILCTKYIFYLFIYFTCVYKICLFFSSFCPCVIYETFSRCFVKEEENGVHIQIQFGAHGCFTDV